MQIAQKADAGMLAIVDSDLISIKPSWVDYLLRPIAFGLADFTVSRYLRDKHDGGITKLLTYPMISTIWGEEIRQPMGGEVGMSLGLVKKCLEHPLFPDDFGIDTFLTTVALANDFKIHGGILDAKFHESTSKYIEPKRHLLTMFHQVTKTLFDLMIYHEDKWKRQVPLSLHEAKRPRKLDRYKGPHPTPAYIDKEAFWNAAEGIVNENKGLLKEITGEFFEELLADIDNKSHVDGDMWSETAQRNTKRRRTTRSSSSLEGYGWQDMRVL
jgi:hypothetical protein